MTTERQSGNAHWMVVVACGVIAAMHVWKLPAALGDVSADLSIDLVQAGLLLGLIQVAGMLGSLPIAVIGERVGLRRAVLVGLGLLTAGTVIGASASSAGMMMGARLLEGAGFILVTVMAPPLIRRDTAPATLTVALGFWTGFQGAATFLALLASSLLLESIDWRAWYWVMAAITLAGIPLLLRFVAPDPGSGISVGSALRRAWLTTLSWKPWVAGLMFACYVIQWTAVIGFLPTIYEGYGISLALGGTLSAIAGGVNAVGAVTAGFLLQRGLGARRLITTAFVVMAVTTFTFYAPDWSQLPGTFVTQLMIVCVFSFTSAMIPTSIYRAAVDLAPAGGSAPAVIGVIQQLQNTGAFLGPTLFAWIATQTGGWQSSWWLCAGASLLGVALVQLFSAGRPGFSMRG